jgi:hypothetical protein
MAGRKNQVILSNYDLTYLIWVLVGDVGLGMVRLLVGEICINFSPELKDVNVIGGETCMWAEISN